MVGATTDDNKTFGMTGKTATYVGIGLLVGGIALGAYALTKKNKSKKAGKSLAGCGKKKSHKKGSKRRKAISY